jgi:hypothetical protein
VTLRRAGASRGESVLSNPEIGKSVVANGTGAAAPPDFRCHGSQF